MVRDHKLSAGSDANVSMHIFVLALDEMNR